jgi:hypothetical protein
MLLCPRLISSPEAGPPFARLITGKGAIQKEDNMATKKKSSRRYGKKASEKVEKAMHEMKQGTLRSGGSGKKVTNPKQAIAIGLSEAREEGGKVPENPNEKKSTSKKKSSTSKKKSSTSKKKSSTSKKKSSR